MITSHHSNVRLHASSIAADLSHVHETRYCIGSSFARKRPDCDCAGCHDRNSDCSYAATSTPAGIRRNLRDLDYVYFDSREMVRCKRNSLWRRRFNVNDSSKAPLSIEPVRKPWGEWASRGSSEGDESMVKSVFPAELSYCAPRFFRKEPSRIRFWILETGSIRSRVR